MERGGGRRVVISQAWRRARARGDSPFERIPFALLQEPPAKGHKEGEKGNYGILYRAGQRRRIFSKETREREKLQCSREGGEEGKVGGWWGGGEESWREMESKMPVCGLQGETGGYRHTVTQSVL